ncbi:hypothetical protein ACH5RR_014753 [Cinchona calisaya]|uniref:Uncharacterized protein n=1 Tax=Cinchona calisaya TaxID=153742 RepID=A0ABD2ZR67_9GENT
MPPFYQLRTQMFFPFVLFLFPSSLPSPLTLAFPLPSPNFFWSALWFQPSPRLTIVDKLTSPYSFASSSPVQQPPFLLKIPKIILRPVFPRLSPITTNDEVEKNSTKHDNFWFA